jgi:hypothetical protein
MWIRAVLQSSQYRGIEILEPFLDRVKNALDDLLKVVDFQWGKFLRLECLLTTPHLRTKSLDGVEQKVLKMPANRRKKACF